MIKETFSPEETFAFGKWIGENALPGQVYTLVGDLGVGKTVFTQGVAEGLGITEPVNSPTFTIIQEYESGRMPFYHFDVYRIGDIEEMEEIGYDDYFLRRWNLPHRVGQSDSKRSCQSRSLRLPLRKIWKKGLIIVRSQ